MLPGDYRDAVDLIVTSPPYDGLRRYGGYRFEFDAVADALAPCLKQGGVLVWIVADAIVEGGHTGSSLRQALGFQNRGLLIHDYLFYADTGGRVMSANRPLRSVQFMFVLSKGKPTTANIPVDRPNVDQRKKAGKICHNPGRKPDGEKKPFRQSNGVAKRHYPKPFGRRTQIWTYAAAHPSPKQSKHVVDGHPAVFPLKLALDLIRAYSMPGDLILDPFMGSGTTLSAAIELKRRAVGVEIHPPYCRLAERRIEIERGGMLFDGNAVEQADVDAVECDRKPLTQSTDESKWSKRKDELI